MTVCIAALANLGKSMVLACDSMLSTPEVSGDKVAYKLYPLSDRYQWWVMIAANDVTHVVPIIDLAIARMLSLSDSTNTCQNIERIVLSAYQSVRAQYVEDLVLTPIGLELADLKNLAWGPDLAATLESVNLGCEFLIAGFDWAGDGYIFSIEHPGIARNHNVAGYASIGIGAYNAISMLLHHSVNCEMELSRVLYHVCESKFMAESAPGVGKHTRVKIATGTGRMEAYEASEEFIDNIRTAWEQEGRPRVPAGYVEHLRETLKKLPTTKSGRLDPQPTTAAPSPRPASQE